MATSRRPVRKDRTDRVNINRDIKAREVRLIDPEGNQVGILPVYKALATANDFGLDLVEISPNARPPVCKVMDYGRYRYEQTKKKQEARKKQSTTQIKGMRLYPKTGDHDLQTKIGHIKKFIGNKDKVKVTMIFRGREIALSRQGMALLDKVAQEMAETAVVEQRPKFEGRTVVMILAPKT